MVLGCLQVPLAPPKPSHPLIVAESLPPGVPKARLSPINEGEAGKGLCPPRGGGDTALPPTSQLTPRPCCFPPPAEAKPQILGRFQVTPSKEPAAASPAPGSGEGEEHGTELAASGSPLPPAPGTGSSSSSSSSSSESEAVVQDPEVEEAQPGEGTVAVAAAAAESEREGAGEEGAEGAPQAVLSQVWLSYSRSLSYVSSDDTESEDEEIWEELQSLRQK